jgi:hypothetical protein
MAPVAGAGTAGALRLEVREFTTPTRWRWVLTDGTGVLIAEHHVRLDAGSWQYEAFSDVYGYLAWQVAPDRRQQGESQIVGQVGEWIAAEVLGPVADALARLARRRPVTVRVVAREAAAELLLRPLELAHVNGKPLSVQDVTFVVQTGLGDDECYPPRARLRVLGLFSLPEGGQALNLRRERHSLVELVRRIAADGKAVDVRVLQYGVTRTLLRDVLAEDDGWDVIHISGHGAPGELLLETADGKPDRMSAEALADLLVDARENVKLVTVAACWSAATSASEQRRRLGLPVPGQRDRDGSFGSGETSGILATELSGRLGCAVIAMRYPVDDEFAIAFSARLYDLLIAKGKQLPQAVGLALRQLARDSADAGTPALSVATPAIFGGTAIGLELTAPDCREPADYDITRLKMAGFPSLPDRFVGRTRVMARASAALAARSGVPGVLLHGMPGGGKTSCALELAYGHEHGFRNLVWYKAPDEGTSIEGTLTDFALTLERYLPGFQMAHMLASQDRLSAVLPLLTEMMERSRLLIVIDNAESLLTDGGEWRDDRWGQVTGALTAHAGLGRVVLTTRRKPASLVRLCVESVDALSADEALLLARELPHLRTLIFGELPGIGRDVSRQLALGVLNVAQGHPKLLELADGQAGHPERLAALVEAGDQAWHEQGGLPRGFFSTGETSATPADFLRVLEAWTRAAARTLAHGELDLFWFLCCLEEPDREQLHIEIIWPFLWEQLGYGGQPPVLSQALSAIISCGLAAIQAETRDFGPSYAIHPGVAAAGRAHAGKHVQDAVDAQVAAYWSAGYQYVSGEAGDHIVHTRLAVRAGLAAVPYLMRQQDWKGAAYLLERAFGHDPSRPNAATVLPAIQHIVRHDPRQDALLALVQRVLDPVAAEAALRASLAAAVSAGDYRAASAHAGRLTDLCHSGGRVAEALTLIERKASYTRKAGLGPWTRLSDDVRRLQVLNAIGLAERVLAEAPQLRGRMDALPGTLGPDELGLLLWSVREGLLTAACSAARNLGQWEAALELSDTILTSMRDRRALATEIAESRFHDYEPLLSLGRTDEALDLLRDCRQVFQEANDVARLGMTLRALAATEASRGHGDAAIRLIRDALRYSYLAGDASSMSVSYHNLGSYLHHARRPAPSLASHLASALILALMDADDSAVNAGNSLRSAMIDAHASGTHLVPPADVADLCRHVGEFSGTDLADLIAQLSPNPEAAERLLQSLIAQAQAPASSPESWEAPVATSQERPAISRNRAAKDSWGAVVDVSNVCWDQQLPPSRTRRPVWSRLGLVMAAWQREHGSNVKLVLVADDSLVHQLDDTREYGQLLKAGKLITRPTADATILALANDQNLHVITRDHYLDSRREHPWIETSPYRFHQWQVQGRTLRIVPLGITASEPHEIERAIETKTLQRSRLDPRNPRYRSILETRWQCRNTLCPEAAHWQGHLLVLPLVTSNGHALCPTCDEPLADLGRRPRVHEIVVEDRMSGAEIMRFPLEADTPVVVGRGLSLKGVNLQVYGLATELVPAVQKTSRRHLILRVEEPGSDKRRMVVTDLGSSNGTTVERPAKAGLGKPTTLEPGRETYVTEGGRVTLGGTVTLRLSGRRYLISGTPSLLIEPPPSAHDDPSAPSTAAPFTTATMFRDHVTERASWTSEASPFWVKIERSWPLGHDDTDSRGEVKRLRYAQRGSVGRNQRTQRAVRVLDDFAFRHGQLTASTCGTTWPSTRRRPSTGTASASRSPSLNRNRTRSATPEPSSPSSRPPPGGPTTRRWPGGPGNDGN